MSEVGGVQCLVTNLRFWCFYKRTGHLFIGLAKLAAGRAVIKCCDRGPVAVPAQMVDLGQNYSARTGTGSLATKAAGALLEAGIWVSVSVLASAGFTIAGTLIDAATRGEAACELWRALRNARHS